MKADGVYVQLSSLVTAMTAAEQYKLLLFMDTTMILDLNDITYLSDAFAARWDRPIFDLDDLG